MATKIEITNIDFNKPRVRYKGKVQDKCDLSFLIHEVAFMAGNTSWPLYSDIYWDKARYEELKTILLEWIDKYNKSHTCCICGKRQHGSRRG